MKSGRSLWYLLAQLSLVVNVAILFSVTLNLDWVRTRAAGGQFDEFPVVIRVVYLLMAFGMLYLLRFLHLLSRSEGTSAIRQLKAARWLGILFLLSTFTQLISRSTDERWNAIPAAIIAVAFLKYSKPSTTSTRS